jgi:hypothetical protein
MQVLKLICWYAVLAPSGGEQITLLNTTAQVCHLHGCFCAPTLPLCLPTAPAVLAWASWCLCFGHEQDKRLEELPLYHDLLQSFTTKEVGPPHARGMARARGMQAAHPGALHTQGAAQRTHCKLPASESHPSARLLAGGLVVHSQREVHSRDAGADRRLWWGVWRAGTHRLQVCPPVITPCCCSQ